MERATAIKKLSALLGKNFGYRINSEAPSAEERAAAREAIPAAAAVRNALKEARDKRHQELLAGDAEYQRLKAEAKVASEKVEQLSSITRHFKITVGLSTGIFFMVKAEGDSWEDVISKVKR